MLTVIALYQQSVDGASICC